MKPFDPALVAPVSRLGFIRAFCESQTMATALTTATALCEAVAPHATVTECRVLPYWKIEGQYEIVLDLTDLAFTALAQALAGQWVMGGDREDPFVIWNAGQDGPFAVPTMTWVNLEIIQPPLESDEPEEDDGVDGL